MDVQGALKQQYHAGLAMLRQCVELCPAELWSAPNPPVTPRPESPRWWAIERPYWKVAFHAIYFTHLYLGQGEGAYQPPHPSLAVRSREDFEDMWHDPWAVEPYDLPTDTTPVTQPEMLAYLDYLNDLLDPTVEGLDLDSESSGFHWYPNRTKLSHQFLNLRHLQGHVGQLSELLIMRGLDIDWK